ncbi:hypothetical protein OAG60_02770 [bacterium]|nr:hypothetical protein [bacterium]
MISLAAEKAWLAEEKREMWWSHPQVSVCCRASRPMAVHALWLFRGKPLDAMTHNRGVIEQEQS